jgi:paraquat-inducible protein B
LRGALRQLSALPLEEMVFDLQKTLRGIEQLVNAPELIDMLRSLHLTLQEVQQFLRQAGGLLERVATGATTTFGSLDSLAAEAQPLLRDATALVHNADKQLERIGSGATAALGSIGKLAQRADTQVQALGRSLNNTSGAAQQTLEQARDTLTAFQNMVAPNAPVGYELAKTLRELSDTARSLRLLADYLERYPNSLLFGKKEGNSK